MLVQFRIIWEYLLGAFSKYYLCMVDTLICCDKIVLTFLKLGSGMASRVSSEARSDGDSVRLRLEFFRISGSTNWRPGYMCIV